MGAGKLTAALQWLASHLVFCYVVLGLSASSAMLCFSYYQVNQQWITTARIAGDIARQELHSALDPLKRETLLRIVSTLGQTLPHSRIALVTGGGIVLVSYPQTGSATLSNLAEGSPPGAVEDSLSNPVEGSFQNPAEGSLNKLAEGSSHNSTEIAWMMGDSGGSTLEILVNENRDRLIISATSGFHRQIAASHSVIIALALLLTGVCAMLHYLHLKVRQKTSVIELMEKLRQSDPERIKRIWEAADDMVTGTDLLDQTLQYLNKLQENYQFQRLKSRQLEIELDKHQQDLGKLVEGRTAELIELNKRFVQKQFDAKTSALEAKQAHWKAEKANQDKTRFLAAASHDLRQPLHAMNLFVEALQPELQTQRAHQIHKDLQRSLATMKELFNSLLDISKLEAGVMQPKMENFKVQQLFDSLEIVFRQQAIENNLDLRIVASSYALYSDPHLLQQVLVNLVSNAIKYTSEGSVFVGCRRVKRHVRLLVWDTGPGIPKHKQSAVFKEFVQLDNPERDRSKGLGLGLSIFKRTCQLLDHPVRFSSIPGVGTRFEIFVPVSNKPKDANPADLAPILNVSRTHLQQQIVLVIDDDPSVLLGMKALLEAWNLQPRLATSVDDAVQTDLLDDKPDLIISDLRLPDGANGLQAIQAIQEFFGSDIPAVLITGDTSPSRLKLATEAPYSLLHKPIKPAQLRSVCTTLLNINTTN